MVIEHKLISESESVTVPGGTFDAARVDTVISIDLKMRGTAIPTKEIKMSVWFSPKVGLVKQRVYGDFGEETVEFVGTE